MHKTENGMGGKGEEESQRRFLHKHNLSKGEGKDGKDCRRQMQLGLCTLNAPPPPPLSFLSPDVGPSPAPSRKRQIGS